MALIFLSISGLHQEVHSEPIIADAFRDIKKKDRSRKKDQTPVAHLSVKTPMDFASSKQMLLFSYI